SLRKAIGQMLQDVFLFSGTIKENITLNDESFSDEEIKKVADYVNASYFIEKLPKKYEEVVIERGENFSSGERQLLSFARTVLAKPQILILDEATANIDTETESIIQQSLEKIKSIGTMLIVAHRLSTIQHCDKIFVLQDGKIIESGSHQDLLKNKGYYYKLYELQFSNN
ncbi:MAG: ATP-binding cassette domain-containing protein, partial [Candidatus Onthovivens sp.]